MRYHLTTYGCQMNEADSSLMQALLAAAGWEPSVSLDSADLVVLNTCAVREKPENKVYSKLGELRAWKAAARGRLIAITGCMAQGEAAEIIRRAPQVDVVLGTRCFQHIVSAAQRALAGEHPVVLTDLNEDPSPLRCGTAMGRAKTALTAFVPIILGCSNWCSYCIVPSVRGPEKSRPVHEIGREVEDLVSRGTREVTLLGQNVLAYGRDLSDRPDLPYLLTHLASTDGLWRIRFTTCHPRDVSGRLIEVMSGEPKICEHIHLPIQAGADKLLREMNRGYTTDDYLHAVDALRAGVRGIAITTDIMVGFPGETEHDFEASLKLYERVRFDAAFTFAYSPRPGTKATSRDDQVPRKVCLERLQRLIALQNRITLERNRGSVGTVAEVLVQGPAERGEGLLAGRSRNNKLVVLPGERRLAGSLLTVRLTEAHLWGFRGLPVAG
jgi:tRNA-2-methylthio-N6-dimethylallyladenosine synthase